MHLRKMIFREIIPAAIGQGICVTAMFSIFLLTGRFDRTVLLGGLAGWMISLLNFFLMSCFACIAAERAEHQDIAGGRNLIRLSYIGRMAGIFLILTVCAGTGWFHVAALAIPLLFTQPILAILELFRGKGEH